MIIINTSSEYRHQNNKPFTGFEWNSSFIQALGEYYYLGLDNRAILLTASGE